MVTDQDLDVLANWTEDDSPVVSFYLDVTGGDCCPVPYVTRMESLVRAAHEEIVRQSYDAAAAENARQDLDHVANYVRGEFKRNGCRGLAIFACAARRFWRVLPLAEPVRDRLVVTSHPYVRPLALYREQSPPCIALILRRDAAWFYLIEQGEVLHQEEWRDDVPGRVRPGSWYGLADKRIERHVDEAIHHLKQVATRLDEQVRLYAVPRIILLGGTRDVIAEFRRTLPRRLRALVAGPRLPEPPEFSPAMVREQVREALRVVQFLEQGALIAEVLAEADRGGYAAMGLEAALAELYKGAVQTLVVSRDQTAPGFLCEACGRLFTRSGACPSCGAPPKNAAPVHDLIEEAVDVALRDGGDVAFVEPTAEWAERGGVGALLRFRCA